MQEGGAQAQPQVSISCLAVAARATGRGAASNSAASTNQECAGVFRLDCCDALRAQHVKRAPVCRHTLVI